jgi:hypothetical protein
VKCLSCATESTFVKPMADQASDNVLGQAPRNSIAPSEKDLQHLFDDSDRVNDGFTSYGDHSSDEDAPTQARVLPAAPSALGSQLSPVRTTELADSIPIFSRHFEGQHAPRYRDIEAGSSIVPPTPSEAPFTKCHGPEIFEIMHNWAQEKEEDESLIAKLNVVKRPAEETNQIRSVRDHIGWL